MHLSRNGSQPYLRLDIQLNNTTLVICYFDIHLLVITGIIKRCEFTFGNPSLKKHLKRIFIDFTPTLSVVGIPMRQATGIFEVLNIRGLHDRVFHA